MGKKLVGRRDFMKSSAAGLGGFIYLSSNEKKEETGKKEKKFVYRTLGNTKIKLPVISMGVMNSDNPNLVRAALDAGIVHLDTAWYYGRGRNEEMIGQIIKGSPRDSYILGTKVALPKSWGKYEEEATETLFLERLHESLKRLQLEYVDILYHHEASNQGMALYEPILNALVKAKKEGKTRFIGISTHSNEPEVIKAAIQSKTYEVVLTSYNYKQNHYLEMRETIAKAAQAGLGVIAMKTMGGIFSAIMGKITGKIPEAAAALKWVLRDPNVHTTIPGFTTFDQMEVDLSVMEDLTLTDTERKLLPYSCTKKGTPPPCAQLDF